MEAQRRRRRSDSLQFSHFTCLALAMEACSVKEVQELLFSIKQR